MGNLTVNFSRHEFRCKCGFCNLDTIDSEVVSVLQDACNYFAHTLATDKVVYIITSGFRCKFWNGHEGGTFDSLHPSGRAADGYIVGVNITALAAYFYNALPEEDWEVIINEQKGYVHIARRLTND